VGGNEWRVDGEGAGARGDRRWKGPEAIETGNCDSLGRESRVEVRGEDGVVEEP
jgi:hypothetical protein